LQDAADPSLLVPATSAWQAKGAAAAALARRGFDARAYLLSALGQCASMSSRIEASLKSAAPSGYETDAAGAHDFLTRTAWLLEQAGFGVLLPAWWTRKGTKLRLAARANVASSKLKNAAGLSLDEIVRVDWQVALGDETLGLAELKALAKLKAPLVRVRGQWVELSADEIEAALDFWKKKSSRMSAREVVRMALGGPRPPGALEVERVDASGWMGDLLARLDGDRGVEELPAPEGLHGTLRPYQTRGYSWLMFLRRWGLGACLADDMGLGKSIQTLATIERDWETDGRRPSLIVCPTSVVANWQKEAARFTPGLPVMVHHGVTRAKGAAFRKQAAKQAIVVSTYALLHRDAALFESVEWRGVILDEAQNVKNPETKQAKAARALPAAYRVALTGTPVENNVGDLWSIMEFLNPGWLGTQAEFRRSYFLPIQTARDPEATSRLKQLTGPFVLRRLKSDTSIIADLPEKLEMRVFCTLTKEQATLYQAVADEATEAIDEARGIKRRGLVLATLTKLKQVCNHPAQFLGDNSAVAGRSGKLARLAEMLEEALSEGDRALVFTQFAEMGEILKRHLQETFGRETLFLHGGVPKKQRDRMIERFQEGGPPVFVLSLKAGGTGLNLTAANRVFHFDRWWNPAVENQATDRAYRIGQTRNVQVHKFVCAGTLEEKIDEMIESKKEVAERVVGTGEAWLTELSTAELKDLFALRRDAVGE
jgi:SNF2 family DNA or RNA helicase